MHPGQLIGGRLRTDNLEQDLLGRGGMGAEAAVETTPTKSRKAV